VFEQVRAVSFDQASDTLPSSLDRRVQAVRDTVQILVDEFGIDSSVIDALAWPSIR
jgi:hypothetical protein